MHNVGYAKKINYHSKINENKPSRNRKRNIIWYISPFNIGVSTEIGRVFLNLLDKYFHKEHKINRIINRNSVKLGYGCTQSMEYINKDHNGETLKAAEKETYKRNVTAKIKTDVH